MRFFPEEDVVGQILDDLGDYNKTMTNDGISLVDWHFNVNYPRCHNSRRDEPDKVETTSSPQRCENRTARI
jgi:hypothetical protein